MRKTMFAKLTKYYGVQIVSMICVLLVAGASLILAPYLTWWHLVWLPFIAIPTLQLWKGWKGLKRAETTVAEDLKKFAIEWVGFQMEVLEKTGSDPAQKKYLEIKRLWLKKSIWYALTLGVSEQEIWKTIHCHWGNRFLPADLTNPQNIRETASIHHDNLRDEMKIVVGSTLNAFQRPFGGSGFLPMLKERIIIFMAVGVPFDVIRDFVYSTQTYQSEGEPRIYITMEHDKQKFDLFGTDYIKITAGDMIWP